MKRVVAIAGDVLEIREGVVLVNGEPTVEDDTIVSDFYNFEKVTIPKHHCFVLGDNRGNSKDSRHFGPVPYIALVGELMFVR